MSEMIERVAKAMWEARRAHVSEPGLELEEWGDGSIPLANNIMGEARAAIEAMQDPTDEMVHALGSEWGLAFFKNWGTALDAALSQP